MIFAINTSIISLLITLYVFHIYGYLPVHLQIEAAVLYPGMRPTVWRIRLRYHIGTGMNMLSFNSLCWHLGAQDQHCFFSSNGDEHSH